MHTTQSQGLYRTAAVAAAAGAIFVLAMMTITIVSGTGFQDFETILATGSIEAYNAKIGVTGLVLKTIYPLDTLYVISYVTLTFVMAQVAFDRRFAAILAMAVALVLAMLDFVENNHLIAMADGVQHGFTVSFDRIVNQTVITQTKFNFGLLLTFTLSFLIPFRGALAQVARWLPRLIVVVAPVALLTPITTIAYLFMNIGLGMALALLFWREAAS